MTRKEAIELIISNFDLSEKNEEGKSFYSMEEDDTATFFFDKRQYFRDEVINKLVSLFGNVNVINGQCWIEPITLLWTVCHIEKRK